MKRITKIFQALLGIAALILTSIIALGRLAWRAIHNRWKRCAKGLRRILMSISVTGVLGFAVLLAYDYYYNMYGRWYRSNCIDIHT